MPASSGSRPSDPSATTSRRLTRRRRPAGLGASGGALWARVTRQYTFRPDEEMLLGQACREVDLIDRLEALHVDAPLVVPGSRGQDVMNPIVQEVRQHRLTLTRLLTALKLPDDPAVGGVRAGLRSAQARDAAGTRWGR